MLAVWLLFGFGFAKSERRSVQTSKGRLFSYAEAGRWKTLYGRFDGKSGGEVLAAKYMFGRIDEAGDTALTNAARYGGLAEIQLLIDNGYSVQASRDTDGISNRHAYLRAAMSITKDTRGKLEYIKERIAKMVQPIDESGNTALMLSARYGSLKGLMYILNIETTETQNKRTHRRAWTLREKERAFLAASKCQTRSANGKMRLLARRIIRKQATNNILCSLTDREGNTAFHLAAEYGSKGAVEFVQKYPSSLKSNKDYLRGETCRWSARKLNSKEQDVLMLAAKSQVDSAVKVRLLARTGDLSRQDQFGNTAFHLAAAAGNIETLTYLNENYSGHGGASKKKTDFGELISKTRDPTIPPLAKVNDASQTPFDMAMKIIRDHDFSDDNRGRYLRTLRFLWRQKVLSKRLKRYRGR